MANIPWLIHSQKQNANPYIPKKIDRVTGPAWFWLGGANQGGGWEWEV